MQTNSKELATVFRQLADKIESGEIEIISCSVGVGDCLWISTNGESEHSRTLSIEYKAIKQ